MAKTQETLSLEAALYALSEKKRYYGCTEVTIGFKKTGHGDEIVDFMSLDSDGIFRCYEIKVSYADLKTDNKKSWYGDYNYLVISESMALQDIDYDAYIPPYTGILVGKDLHVKRKAKQYPVNDREMLQMSLLRSVYWKMLQYKKAGNLDDRKALMKQLEDTQKEFASYTQKVDRKMWTVTDYEHYYALNHQLPFFDLEQQVKEERKQYFLRDKQDFHWIKEKTYTCPICGYRQEKETNFCPQCGTDLRELCK